MEYYEVIKTIDDIKDINVKYKTESSRRWFEICKDNLNEYTIYGLITGDVPEHVFKGQYVITWKTFSGVKKAIKRLWENQVALWIQRAEQRSEFEL